MDREHEHGSRRQQEAVSDERGDHQANRQSDDDVRSGRLGSCLARDSQSLWHGLPGALRPGTAALHQLLAPDTASGTQTGQAKYILGNYKLSQAKSFTTTRRQDT